MVSETDQSYRQRLLGSEVEYIHLTITQFNPIIPKPLLKEFCFQSVDSSGIYVAASSLGIIGNPLPAARCS